MDNLFSLKGKTILITGAASGIGRATAQLCTQSGARVVLVDMNENGLAEMIKTREFENSLSFPADLTDNTKVEDIATMISNLDGIVCNAGIVLTLLAKFNEQSDLDRLFRVNTFSHINLVQALIRNKKLKKGASIVFTSSMSGVFCGIAGGSLYGATKAALVGYSKALAIELAPRGIRVNTVHPGMVETPLTYNTALSQDVLAEDIKNYPLGRYGRPEEVAAAMVYLLSDATAWMTGSQLLIDGGYSLR